MLKICGINNLDFAIRAEEFGVNYLGFIFFEKSPRYVNIKLAHEIINKLQGKSKKVGVFVDLDIQKIFNISKFLSLDVIQLHNEYKEEDIYFLKNSNYKFEVWRVLYDKIINSNADGFVVDKKNNNSFGGTGEKSDWKLAKKLKLLNKKVILAGGLNRDNIIEAYKLHPDVFDINSGLEIEKGQKSIKKLEDFFVVWNNINKRIL